MTSHHPTTNGIFRRRWQYELYRKRLIQPRQKTFPFDDQVHAAYCLNAIQVYQSGLKTLQIYRSGMKVVQVYQAGLNTSQTYQSGLKVSEVYQSGFKTLQVGCR